MSFIFVNDKTPRGARGMARYFKHVVEGLIAHFGDQVVVFSAQPGSYAPARHLEPVSFKGSEQFGLHDKQASLAVRRVKPKIVYNSWFTTLRSAVPQVCVVYDLIYELFPQYHAWWQVPLRNLDKERQHSFEQADILIAISHSTAYDVTEIYPNIDPTKIVVIHLGVDSFFFEKADEVKVVSAKPYLLYVGARGSHKNFQRLLQAFSQSELSRDFELRILSSTPFTPAEREWIDQYQLQSSIELILGSDDLALRQHYAQAAAFVYPSEYEGFGLPILEALACGTVVLTSNISSMPELGRDIALYFDPYQVDSMVTGLRQVVSLSPLDRAERVTAGIQHARTFTWERCQEQTVNVIRNLLS